VQLYTLSGATANELRFRAVETVAANTPCLFMKNTADATSVVFTATSNAVSVADPSLSEAVDGLTIKGTYSKLDNQTGMYFIAQDEFWKADAAITINPFRAYFTSQESGSAKMLNIVIDDDDATSIGRIENGEIIMNDSGKYIENGNIVIVKNGKKYSTSGQALR